MADRFLMQPNGLLAVFSEIVDTFTRANLTQDQAIEIATTEMKLSGPDQATAKVARGLERGVHAAGGWNECLETIKLIHGEKVCADTVEEIMGPAEEDPEPIPAGKRRCLLSSRDDEIPGLDQTVDLTSDEIVSFIIKHGRAVITERSDGSLEIEFQQGYD